MTDRNFTTVIPGFYRTRNGRIAEVIQILDERLREDYHARGFIGAYPDEWTMEKGFNFNAGHESKNDLITFLGVEKPKETRMVTKTIRYWANVLGDGAIKAYSTKDMADDYSFARIACVEMTGEYQVEVYE